MFPVGTAIFFGTHADTKEPVAVLQYKGNICAFTYDVLLDAAQVILNELQKDTDISQHLKATGGIN
jgi:hypothetical protein